jgi:hypothetical protein
MSDFKSLKAIRKQRAAPASFVSRTTAAEASKGNDAQSSNESRAEEVSAEGLAVAERRADQTQAAQNPSQVSRHFGSPKVLPEKQAGPVSASRDEQSESSETEPSAKALMDVDAMVEDNRPEKQDYEGLYKVLPPSLEIRTSKQTGRGLYSSVLYKPGASDRTVFSAASKRELTFLSIEHRRRSLLRKAPCCCTVSTPS